MKDVSLTLLQTLVNATGATFEDEIADTFLRLFDFVVQRCIDIEKHIMLKMAFNSTREYKHGKSY